MRHYKAYILPLAAAMTLLTGCDDQIMEWGKPAGEGTVTTAEIPLAVKEVLANYEDIKTYSAQYTPHLLVGVGASAAMYVNTEDGTTYQDLVNQNYQMVTMGNAMKMDAVVTNSGTLNFANIDAALATMPQDMRLYGHVFAWYQQTNQTYLRSLIAPTLVVISDSDIETMLGGDDADFNGGTQGSWSAWGGNMKSYGVEPGAGEDGSAAMTLTNTGDGEFYQAQFGYTITPPLDPTTEYTIRFKAKSTSAAGKLQFQYQNGTTYGSQGGYHEFEVGTDWTTCEFSFTPAYDDVNRILINFGKVGGTYTIDDIEFGVKKADPMDNVMAGDNSDFEGGTTGAWGSWGNSSTMAVSAEGEGYEGGYCMTLTNPSDGSDYYVAQAAYDFDLPLVEGETYVLQFWAKASEPGMSVQFATQNSSTYAGEGYHAIELTTDWAQYEHEYTCATADINRLLINFGKFTGTYYIDNVKFGVKKAEAARAKRAATRASSSYYVLKTPEEKRTALLGAMDMWIKGMAEHLAEKGVVPYGYDVINEPIADGSNLVRGVDDGVFGGSDTDDDGNVTYDSEPVETEETGLTLNWGSNRFYWGYYVKDYAVQAFQMARKYLPAETKLFVNDYNLETSPAKLDALINFVKAIDEANGSPIVDGIGTQMHVSFSPTDNASENETILAELKERVDAQFKTMAATGKLVRITELDVSVGTGTPSATQYKAQSDAYQLIIRSYLDNVPEAQQSGFTIWGVSDHPDEHVYWLTGQVPNIFDANYLRKWAYKGVCDAIANQDLGLQYGGDDYKAYYEKNNVSSTVN